MQLQEEGSELLLHVWVPLRQITHTEIYKKILSNNPLETKVLNFSYSNQLAYFYVEVVETDSLGQKNVHILKPVYNGLYNDITATEEYINYLFLDDNNIRLTFDRESYQPRTNAEVTIHVFTTLGSEANFTLADSYRKVSTISSDRFNYNRLYYYLTTISDSVDGRNKLDVSALKTIIPQEALSRGSITTFTDLNNAFNSVQTPDIHIEFLKKVDNQVERLWYAYLLMKDDNGNIVPTNTITACFNKSIFSNTNKFNFILKPGTLFYQDPDTGVINGYTNDLSDDEKEKMDTDSFLFMTPFLTVITKSPFYVCKTNVEFIRVVNETTVKMRVWERGNGETWACGTGAAAAAVACVLRGFCKRDTDVTVKVKGGDLIVCYHSDGTVTLTGNVQKIYEGKVEF